ncbi:hypothetical protein [Streptomyces sp. NPDC059247]|uniref:hypothetical protein n=1 Tax=Streptomyces sp. NPDC059247 TaxID=3346790 RepID=UPI00368A91DC
MQRLDGGRVQGWCVEPSDPGVVGRIQTQEARSVEVGAGHVGAARHGEHGAAAEPPAGEDPYDIGVPYGEVGQVAAGAS